MHRNPGSSYLYLILIPGRLSECLPHLTTSPARQPAPKEPRAQTTMDLQNNQPREFYISTRMHERLQKAPSLLTLCQKNPSRTPSYVVSPRLRGLRSLPQLKPAHRMERPGGDGVTKA
ncbi:hypothetical protein CCUS01_17391 [Colletotrichum cuscutae]|uniref:Uncharacterized protein n=1 Tax=Colletotrichum cuscutae TaxID=1209917 RepID=A0AAI9V5D8_9PEZI|nr:hypothetical protein CCUS01_17391 [Colletotrichum cuscutae]